METKLVTMTPEWAASILSTNNNQNRKIRPNAVKKITEAICRGDWQVTHQGIAIDANGALQDGQHRLSAIVLANRSVEILLTTGCNPNSFSVLDCGVARTASDSLERLGSKYSGRAAAGIKIYFLYKKYPEKVWSNIDMPPHTQIVDYYINHQDVVDWASVRGNRANCADRSLNPSAIVTFLLLTADNQIWRQGEEFIDLLVNPVMQKDTSPILAYRRLLQGGLINKQNLQQRSLASIIKCFNYWAQDIPLKQFKQPSITPMPVIENILAIK